ncbi:phospholipase D/nuclease, partial [Aureobasidium melanogenum]
MADFSESGRPRKKARLSDSTASTVSPPKDEYSWNWPADLAPSTIKPISPPPLTRNNKGKEKQQERSTITQPSPFQLTRIRDLPASANVDTVTLSDILGDPMIKEQWQFNFLLDIDFIMSHLDEDVRDTVQTKIIHGFHKQNDPSRLNLEATAKKYPNVETMYIWLPAFGTHHSKMMILIRHDDTAQVVIHTANMISQDWSNLTQAVWRSPLLPLSGTDNETSDIPIGSGARFKRELLNYLQGYKSKFRDPTRPLIDQLKKYDFSSIKAALVASVPGKQQIGTDITNSQQSLWGWPGLERVLKEVPATTPASKAQINVQISSIGTLYEKWLNGFFDVLRTTTTGQQPRSEAASVRVIFPTADEVRRSLDGYQSGSSIHMKLDSDVQRKQLSYMKPLLCTWAGDTNEDRNGVQQAGRRRAAPHIKTFIRFSDNDCNRIDWTLVTSANLSKQAWGEMANKNREVNIASFEIGVLICPQWLAGEGEKASMVPVFKKDNPDVNIASEGFNKLIGVRMPYDLPLAPYAGNEVPWCAERPHDEPDWKGLMWQTYNPRV